MKTIGIKKIWLAFTLIIAINAILSSKVYAQQVVREISDFSQVEYSLPCRIEIKQGDKVKLTLEGDKNEIDKIITKIENGIIKIYTEQHNFHLTDVKLFLTVVNLEKFTLSGSGDAIFPTGLKSKSIILSLSGSGDIGITNLTSSEVSLRISGSGAIKATGMATEKLDASISGSGDINASDLETKDASVEITGSGTALVNATINLKTNIVGSGSIRYKGKPLIDAKTIGSGSTKPL